MRAYALHARFKSAFGPAYQAQYSSAEVLFDLQRIEEVDGSGKVGFHLYKPAGGMGNTVRFKLYNPENEIPLLDVLPVFEHMASRLSTKAVHIR